MAASPGYNGGAKEEKQATKGNEQRNDCDSDRTRSHTEAMRSATAAAQGPQVSSK
jgi:hypothetical protein